MPYDYTEELRRRMTEIGGAPAAGGNITPSHEQVLDTFRKNLADAIAVKSAAPGGEGGGVSYGGGQPDYYQGLGEPAAPGTDLLEGFGPSTFTVGTAGKGGQTVYVSPEAQAEAAAKAMSAEEATSKAIRGRWGAQKQERYPRTVPITKGQPTIAEVERSIAKMIANKQPLSDILSYLDERDIPRHLFADKFGGYQGWQPGMTTGQAYQEDEFKPPSLDFMLASLERWVKEGKDESFLQRRRKDWRVPTSDWNRVVSDMKAKVGKQEKITAPKPPVKKAPKPQPKEVPKDTLAESMANRRKAYPSRGAWARSLRKEGFSEGAISRAGGVLDRRGTQ